MGDLICFYDTETTDVTDFKAAYNAPHQPNLIQLGYKVVEPRTRETIFEVGHLVDTTGFETWKGISPGAMAAHGIRAELLQLYGSAPDATMHNFERWCSACSYFVAHNDSFDTNVLQCFAFRAGWDPGSIFHDQKKFCTMKSSTDICKIPSPRGGNKWPRLDEAYAYFNNGAKFSGAHNALADVGACESIFWALVDGGHHNVGWV